MTALAPPEPTAPVTRGGAPGMTRAPIPLPRLVQIELRKSFDTRAGLWLLAGIGIASLLVTAAVILFAPADQLTYGTFTQAISVPMSVILPMIAILSVTAEWSQRTGLTTFTLVPQRGRVLLGKALAIITVAVLATLVALAVGALGNVVGTAIAGTPTVWDQDPAAAGYLLLANTLLLMVGFMLGVLLRNSPGAIVAYFVYAFVLPPALTLLAFSQAWFDDLRPWVDAGVTRNALQAGHLTADQWSQLAVTSTIWLVIPLVIGVRTLIRSEIK